jgi:hypothetical protein
MKALESLSSHTNISDEGPSDEDLLAVLEEIEGLEHYQPNTTTDSSVSTKPSHTMSLYEELVRFQKECDYTELQNKILNLESWDPDKDEEVTIDFASGDPSATFTEAASPLVPPKAAPSGPVYREPLPRNYFRRSLSESSAPSQNDSEGSSSSFTMTADTYTSPYAMELSTQRSPLHVITESDEELARRLQEEWLLHDYKSVQPELLQDEALARKIEAAEFAKSTSTIASISTLQSQLNSCASSSSQPVPSPPLGEEFDEQIEEQRRILERILFEREEKQVELALQLSRKESKSPSPNRSRQATHSSTCRPPAVSNSSPGPRASSMRNSSIRNETTTAPMYEAAINTGVPRGARSSFNNTTSSAAPATAIHDPMYAAMRARSDSMDVRQLADASPLSSAEFSVTSQQSINMDSSSSLMALRNRERRSSNNIGTGAIPLASSAARMVTPMEFVSDRSTSSRSVVSDDGRDREYYTYLQEQQLARFHTHRARESEPAGRLPRYDTSLSRLLDSRMSLQDRTCSDSLLSETHLADPIEIPCRGASEGEPNQRSSSTTITRPLNATSSTDLPPHDSQDPTTPVEQWDEDRRLALVRRGQQETAEAVRANQAHVVECRGCRSRMQAPIHYALVYCTQCGVVSPGQEVVRGRPRNRNL